MHDNILTGNAYYYLLESDQEYVLKVNSEPRVKNFYHSYFSNITKSKLSQLLRAIESGTRLL